VCELEVEGAAELDPLIAPVDEPLELADSSLRSLNC